MPTALLVVLVVLAVAVGLYLGARASQARPQQVPGRAAPKGIGTRARDAATRGVVELWRWNRARKKKARDRDDERE